MRRKILSKLIVTLTIIILPGFVWADFGTRTNIGTGVDLSSIALGDIDNDGDLDLIVTGYDGSGRRLDKYINNGAGSFTKYTNWGTRIYRSSIALGDIDNDGDLDLIVTGYDGSGGRLDKYKNNGFGSFSGPTSFGTGVYYSSIALGDIDNDGDLDLIVTGYSSSGYRLDKYINNGAGSFSGSSLGPGVYFSSIALGDIDNDGDLDLIVTGVYWDGFYWVYRLDRYRNLEATSNNKPNSPTGMSSEIIGGYWRFKWNASSDDHTPVNMLRYKVAYGTNSGVYKLSSTNIDYPRGQANLGNVCVVTGKWYQSKVSAGKKVYWKVCAIDSAFKYSAYSSEQVAIPPVPNSTSITKCTSLSTNKISLVWTNVSYELGYKIYRSLTNNTNTATQVGTTGINVTNWTNTGLSQNTKYYYWVKAYNDSGYSSFSAVASNITFLSAPLDSYITLTAISTNAIKVEVTPPPNSTLGLTGCYITNYTNRSSSGWLTGKYVWTNYGLLPSKIYGYRVKYRNGNGEETLFNANVKLRYTLAKAPSSIWATGVTPNSINVAWLGSGATRYLLKRADSIGGPWTTRYSNASTNYNDTGLTPDKTYHYRVYGVNGDLIVTTNYAYFSNQTLIASNSINVTTIAISTNSIKVSWKDFSTETSYTLFRNTNSNPSGAVKFGFTANQTNYTDTNLSVSTKYYYWVKAYNSGGGSGYSPYSARYTLTKAPSSLVSTYTTESKIGLSWSGGNATKYVVKSSTNLAGPYLTRYSNAATSFTDTGLLRNTIYYYRVYGCNGDGILTVNYASNIIATKIGAPSVEYIRVTNITGLPYYRGDIKFKVKIRDEDSTRVSITVKYKNLEKGISGVARIREDTYNILANQEHIFTWDSANDIKDKSMYIILEVTPRDSDWHYGPSKEIDYPIFVNNIELKDSEDLRVDNSLKSINESEGMYIMFKAKNSGEVTVSVYNVLGKKIREMKQIVNEGFNMMLWDYKDEKGNLVSSEVYIIWVKGAGVDKYIKVAVWR